MGTPKTYSNPRTEAVIENWPHGAQRTTATFRVEADQVRGERASRVTIDPKTGKPGAPKKLTYAHRVRIVDGDDGRTYIIMQARTYPMVSVMRSDMKLQEEVVHEDDPRYAALLDLLTQNGE